MDQDYAGASSGAKEIFGAKGEMGGRVAEKLRRHIQDAGRNLLIAIKQSRSAEAA